MTKRGAAQAGDATGHPIPLQLEDKMDIDIERLKVDAAYWDEVAKPWATHFDPFLENWINYNGGWLGVIHVSDDSKVWRTREGVLPSGAIPRPTQWSGDGLPPVGEIVEFDLRPHGLGANDDCSRWHDGQHVEVLAHKERNGTPIAVVYNPAFNAAAVLCSEAMHPLKSDKERAVEAALKVCPYPGSACTRVDVEALYDAGLLTIPKA